MRMKELLSPLVLATAVLFPAVAHADDPKADAAFRRGIELMGKGEIREACIAFEESERLETKAGTLLNLADCYERSARWAEAYRTFERARDGAVARGRADWQALASEHLAQIRPKIALVTIGDDAVGSLPDARVIVDGRTVLREELRRGVALAPGAHVIRAEAAGHRPSEQTITTPPDAHIVLTPLELEPTSTLPARGAEPPQSPVRKTVGLVFGAAGLGALAFGGVSGFVASGALSDAKDACSSYPDQCSPAAAEPNERATTWSTISTVGLISGAALVAVGVALYFWPASATTPSTARRSGAPSFGLSASGLGLAFQ